MKNHMTRKEFQEWLDQFPEDAIICTDTSNHYSTDGIKYGTLIECGKENDKSKMLFIGNTRHVGNLIDGIGKFENHAYNLVGLKLLKAISIYKN